MENRFSQPWRHHTFSVARLLGRATALSMCVCAGYAVGLTLIVIRHIISARIHDLPQQGMAHGITRLGQAVWFYDGDSRIPYTRFDYISGYADYPRIMCSIAAEAVSGVFVVAVAATLSGLVLARFGSFMLSPAIVWNTPSHQLPARKRQWKVLITKSRVQWTLVSMAAVALGFCAPILGEAHALIADHISSERAWSMAPPGTSECIRPFFALLAWPDGLWLLCGAFLLAIFAVVLPARYAIRFDPASLARWCFACGYQREGATDPSKIPTTPCPECGHAPALPNDARGAIRLAWLGVAALFVLSLAVFFLVPRLLSNV